jgi:hypothetical protein
MDERQLQRAHGDIVPSFSPGHISCFIDARCAEKNAKKNKKKRTKKQKSRNKKNAK